MTIVNLVRSNSGSIKKYLKISAKKYQFGGTKYQNSEIINQ
jgi:hypothetical protein